MFNPNYNITDKIVKALIEIAEAKAVIDRAKLLPKQELRLKRQALIRMSHSSTAIEGNQLNLGQVEALYDQKSIDAPSRDIWEVSNYLAAMRYIETVVKKKVLIDEKILLHIHKLVTDKTLPPDQSGTFRKCGVCVVRRRLGLPNEIIYSGPKFKDVPKLCQDFLSWLNDSKNLDINPVIVAGIAHQEIAAIHPFADGNGRTARALATLILYSKGYDFKKLFALEDYYNQDLPSYYKAISFGNSYQERLVDFTPWLEYFTEGFREEIFSVKKKVQGLAGMKLNDLVESQIFLTPAQTQIIDFIDQIGKITVKDVMDILNLPRRTAQLQLQKLKTLGIIKQVGKGPASGYVLEK